jgi:hypothetical protein
VTNDVNDVFADTFIGVKLLILNGLIETALSSESVNSTVSVKNNLKNQSPYVYVITGSRSCKVTMEYE